MSAEKSKVYFSRVPTPENVVKLYEALGVELQGKIAVKVHSGEEGNQNYLRPEFMKPMVEHVKGTVVECNTAYGGKEILQKNILSQSKDTDGVKCSILICSMLKDRIFRYL